MMRGMFAAISGLKTHQVMLDVTANDIANVNTIGYKSARATFKDSLSQLQRGASGQIGSNAGTNSAQVGLGVQLGSIDNLMSTGATQSTGNPYDVAIQGSGFFRVGLVASPTAVPVNPQNLQYTRAGNFTCNQEGFLVTQDGYYVLGQDDGGNPIALKIPPDASGLAIAQDGEVSYIDPAPVDPAKPRKVVGFISLAMFPNAAGLERSSNNRWQESANSGKGVPVKPGEDGSGFTTPGAIEMSNVDLASAFTSMFTAQRGFQANSRVISTSDEMLQDLVNLKR